MRLPAAGFPIGRRGAAACWRAAAPFTPCVPGGVRPDPRAYETAMRASGRPVSLTDAQFDAIQRASRRR